MKKIALSLVVAGVMSGALAQETANLANIAPGNYGEIATTLDFYYKGKDIWGNFSFAPGIDIKAGLAQALGGELYLRLAGHVGYMGSDAQRFISGSGGLGWSQQLSENNFAAIEANYKYGVATADRLYQLKYWQEYGVTATYGYKVADWFSIGVSGFYDKNKYENYGSVKFDGSTYGFGVPASFSVTKNVNLNIYAGYQSQKLDNSDIKKSQPIVTLGLTGKF